MVKTDLVNLKMTFWQLLVPILLQQRAKTDLWPNVIKINLTSLVISPFRFPLEGVLFHLAKKTKILITEKQLQNEVTALWTDRTGNKKNKRLKNYKLLVIDYRSITPPHSWNPLFETTAKRAWEIIQLNPFSY